MTHPKTNDCLAKQLANDPRVAEAKQLLKDAVEEQQKKIKGISSPNPKKAKTYENLIKKMGELRGSSLYYPYLGSGFGKGPFVELADESIKYDFISGIGVHFFGHHHPDLLDSNIDAALSDVVMQGNLQQNQDSVTLLELLLKTSKMDHGFLTSSGVMANENALKIAFQKNFPASRVLAFEHCFMGRTLAISQITDKPTYREGLPSNVAVDYIPFFNPNNPDSIKTSLNALHTHLKRYPNQYAAMSFELVQGEAGFYFAPREFYVALMEILRQHNIAILIDEVQTFARTPELFAFQYFDLEEFVDIVTIGKLSHTCATLFKKEYNPKPGLLSQTFTSSTAAIRAATTIIQHLTSNGYYGPEGKIIRFHNFIKEQFHRLEEKHGDHIKGPYGIGAMVAFTVFGGDSTYTHAFARALYDAGVISFVAGIHPSRIRFLLPTPALEEADITAVIQIIDHLLEQGPPKPKRGPLKKLLEFWQFDSDG